MNVMDVREKNRPVNDGPFLYADGLTALWRQDADMMLARAEYDLVRHVRLIEWRIREDMQNRSILPE